MRARRLTGPALVVIAAALWGTVGAAFKLLTETAAPDADALVVGFYRMAFAVPLLALLAWRAPGVPRMAARARPFLVLIGIGAAMACYQAFYFSAVHHAGIAIATLVTICGAPVFVIVLARPWLGERLTRPVLVALPVALIGVGLLLAGSAPSPGRVSAVTVGAALALGAAFSYAAFTLLCRAVAHRFHPFQLVALGFGAAAQILLPVAMVRGLAVSEAAGAWAILLYMGLVPTGLAYVFYFAGMRGTRATTASLVTLVEPLTATLIGVAAFNERLGPAALAGAVLLIGALVVIFIDGRRRAAPTDAVSP